MSDNGIKTSTAIVTEINDNGGKLEDNGESKHFGEYSLMHPVEVGDKVEYRSGKLGESNVILCVNKI